MFLGNINIRIFIELVPEKRTLKFNFYPRQSFKIFTFRVKLSDSIF